MEFLPLAIAHSLHSQFWRPGACQISMKNGTEKQRVESIGFRVGKGPITKDTNGNSNWACAQTLK